MNTFKMIKCDEPTVNDRVYLEEEVELAIAKWNKIDYERLGEMNDHNPEPALAINLDRVSHIVKDTYIDDEGWWIGVIEPLGTPMGNILTQLLESGIRPKLLPRSTGMVSDDGKVTDIDIISLDFSAIADVPKVDTVIEAINGLQRKST